MKLKPNLNTQFGFNSINIKNDKSCENKKDSLLERE